MNLYLSLGRMWTGTQADAKEAQGGKNFVHVDVPTDKPGLIAFLNELPTKFPGMFEGDDDTHSYDDERAKANDDPVIDPEDAPVAVKKAVPAPVTGDCPACNRTKRVAQISSNSQASVNIIADLEDVTDMASLTRIIVKIKERHAAIASKNTAPLQGSEASEKPA